MKDDEVDLLFKKEMTAYQNLKSITSPPNESDALLLDESEIIQTSNKFDYSIEYAAYIDPYIESTFRIADNIGTTLEYNFSKGGETSGTILYYIGFLLVLAISIALAGISTFIFGLYFILNRIFRIFYEYF